MYPFQTLMLIIQPFDVKLYNFLQFPTPVFDTPLNKFCQLETELQQLF